MSPRTTTLNIILFITNFWKWLVNTMKCELWQLHVVFVISYEVDICTILSFSHLFIRRVYIILLLKKYISIFQKRNRNIYSQSFVVKIIAAKPQIMNINSKDGLINKYIYIDILCSARKSSEVFFFFYLSETSSLNIKSMALS